MEFENVILNRRSIRKYKEKEVEKDKIDKIIQAAICGPTWKNTQTARYHVILDKQKRKEFLEKCLIERNAINATNATIIVASYVKNKSGFNTKENIPDNELGNKWGVYDLGLCNENLVLEAYNLGLGTLIMGMRHTDAIKEMLDIASDEEVVSVIAVGYPDIEPTMPKRNDIDDFVKYY